MLKPKNNGELLGYLTAGYFLFAEMLSWVTSNWPSPCLLISEHQPTDYQPSHETCATVHEGIARALSFLWDHATPNNISVAATVVIAVFTLTLWRATDRLWDAGERQLVHLKESAERQLGAYIGIEWCRIISHDGGSTFEVEVQIKNAGQTQAYDVTHRIAADIQVRNGEPINFAMPERSRGVIPIAPGITFILRTPIAIGGASGTADIGTNRIIFARGRVDYIDVFDKPQHLEFRYRNADRLFHNGHLVGWRMDAEDEGNSAT
jgi:hypothetical protein